MALRRAAVTAVGLAGLLGLFLHTAWLSDDAFITYRTIDNFLNGYGLRWNVVERVQAYTHPLWMMLVTAAVLPLRNFVLVPLLLSVAVSTFAAAVLLRRVAVDAYAVLLGAILLGGSKAFVDYSSSGLENPLTHLLLAGLLAAHFAPTGQKRRGWTIGLAAGLVVLNRFDNAILVAPILCALVLEHGWIPSARWLRPLGQIALGFVPLVLWEGFSIFYYGFPFPNTAYAKLQTGIGPELLRPQGFHYLGNSAIVDPLTLSVVLSATLIAVVRRRRAELVVALGIALYLVYTVRIGGDFMSGRFLAAPFLMSVAIVVRERFAPGRERALPVTAALLISLSSPSSPLWFERDFGSRHVFPKGNLLQIDRWGVADERWVYFRAASIRHYSPGQVYPANLRVYKAMISVRSASVIEPGDAIGFYGFSVPRDRHIVDIFGLSDPLLARLPVADKKRWRIGHFNRDLPQGYVETLGTGIPVIRNPDVADYYRVLQRVTRDDLFSAERFREIWRINTGHYDHLLPRS